MRLPMTSVGRALFLVVLVYAQVNLQECRTRVSAAFNHNLPVSEEKLLVKRLLDRYARLGKIGRPVLNTSETVTVNFDLSLIQIVDVDEKNQVLVTNIWYNYVWTDHLLKWDPEEHGNISNIRVPSDRIWLPDILLYNFADTRLKEQREALVVVNYTGGTLWMPQAILKSSCFFDITFFPFDDQECKLKFGSWTYDGFKVDVVFRSAPKMDLNDYMLSNEWDIMENVAVRNVRKYACCPEPYPDLTFRLRLRRKVAFYSFILILPCALLSLLTLVIFWVPPESPAKLQLGMNIFVAFFVLLLLLAESTPRAASSIPLIGAYFCLSMVMITLSTVFACVVANMFFRGVRVHRAPYWLRAVMIDGIARVLFLRDQVMDKNHKEQSKMRNWNVKVTGENNKKFPAADAKFAKVRLLENKDEKMSASSDTLEPSVPDTVIEQHDDRQSLMRSAILEEVKAIREMLDKVQEKKMKLEEREKLVREWRVIACVTDRLFFIVYVLVNVIGVLVIFVRK
ncbi:neuronal acetylcholine receptor subunit alpha-3 isoform X5 [Octopus bimaculoides]|uniref:neuronal acetylcholine receptor subunit alpha-3 isoform X5 n=1 Tax=Octopus bimaculoides TaxID=37653 RepID=UPI00071E1606|nr:neuronal acetylcholine receptor subunit alpha-3 isoform X5 [Octopus bimaculoides]|eukprot:XP_014776336.1 PREDICTED: neuronal acetylcholine receptor subunit alpha-3-like isoform X3 [Octopus bimaculoides]